MATIAIAYSIMLNTGANLVKNVLGAVTTILYLARVAVTLLYSKMPY